MKLRLGWLADADDADSYSARETRVLLRAIARLPDVVPLWFAVGSTEPPHFFNGIRVFPVPVESLASAEFLKTLVAQQRPHIVLSNLERSRFPVAFQYLAQNGTAWIHRINPADAQSATDHEAPLRLVGKQELVAGGEDTVFVPYLRGLDKATPDGEEPTAVLRRLQTIIARQAPVQALPQVPQPTHLVMRQQLFCNASLAHVMFEITNALIGWAFRP